MFNYESKSREVESVERKGHGYSPTEHYGSDLAEVEEYREQTKRNKPIVKEILESWDDATNNDTLLFFEFLRVKYPDIEVTSSKDNVIFKFPKNQVKFFPSPESVTRVRRSLNSKGIGLPTNPKVFKRRMKRQKVIQQFYRKEKN